jgi:hypothetical protein
MSILWIIVLDILIAIIGFYSVLSIFNLLSFFNFERPYTIYLISKGIIKPTLKKQLLGVELASSLIIFLLGNGLCLLGAYFTKPSGFIVLGVVAFIALVFFRPTKDRYTISPYNIEHYVRRHSVCMDIEEYKKLVEPFIISD